RSNLLVVLVGQTQSDSIALGMRIGRVCDGQPRCQQTRTRQGARIVAFVRRRVVSAAHDLPVLNSRLSDAVSYPIMFLELAEGVDPSILARKLELISYIGPFSICLE